jgi:hypothetical protein
MCSMTLTSPPPPLTAPTLTCHRNDWAREARGTEEPTQLITVHFLHVYVREHSSDLLAIHRHGGSRRDKASVLRERGGGSR